jgi:hypothetical protein
MKINELGENERNLLYFENLLFLEAGPLGPKDCRNGLLALVATSRLPLRRSA